MNRTALIAEALGPKGIDGIFVSELRNVRYLSGFNGTAGWVLITKHKNIFCTDPRYEEQAAKEVAGFDIWIEREELYGTVVETAKSAEVRTLGFETSLSYELYRKLLRKGVKIKAVSNLVEDMRKIKDRLELKAIRAAVERAESAFQQVRPYVKKGMSEKKMAGMLQEHLRKEGCSALPFDIIVAAGRNSSMPHARPTDYKFQAGDFIIVDWGGEAGGYFSDLTRTFLVKGRDLSRKKEIYDAVLTANRKAIASVREGELARTVDMAARDEIASRGYGDFFSHGTGHGIGLEVHELPRISRRGRESIKSGMIFTIEPGVYIQGLGGVRIEDMVLARKAGSDVLTTLPKLLEIIN